MTALKTKSANVTTENVTSANLAIGTAVCAAFVASVLGLTFDVGGRGPDTMASGWNLRGPLPAIDVPRPGVPKTVQVLPDGHLA